MASFLDIGVLSYFGVIFAFLVVFIIIYGILSFVKPFGEGKAGLYALLGIAFGVLAVTNNSILFIVSFMTPWFFVVIFLGFFIIFILMMFGLKSSELRAGSSPYFRIWPIIFGLLILFFALAGAFGQQSLDQTTGGSSNGDGTVVNDDTNDDGVIDIGDVPTSSGIDNVRNDVAGSGTSGSTATGDFEDNVWNTFVNPSVLGMILLMLIGAFALFFLTKEVLD